jgi:hypothetical protein
MNHMNDFSRRNEKIPNKKLWYKYKYIKYKIKFERLGKQVGGRINIAKVNTKITKINYPSEKYNLHKKDLIELYKKCEPKEETFSPLLEKSMLLILKNNNFVIGFLVLTPTILLQKDPKYYDKGGLDEPGLFLTSLCGDSKYTGISNPLLNKLNAFSQSYTHILLHVSVARDKVKGIYERNGFVVQKIITLNDEKFYVMRKVFPSEKCGSSDIQSFSPISFPKFEIPSYKKRLDKGHQISTHRIMHEYGKYKLGEIYFHPDLGNLRVVSVTDLIDITYSPIYKSSFHTWTKKQQDELIQYGYMNTEYIILERLTDKQIKKLNIYKTSREKST